MFPLPLSTFIPDFMRSTMIILAYHITDTNFTGIIIITP
jgi:hypothetical protein